MITKHELIRGTVKELQEYCDSILKPASERGKTIGKFYLKDPVEISTIFEHSSFGVLPYLECTSIRQGEINMEMKILYLFLAPS